MDNNNPITPNPAVTPAPPPTQPAASTVIPPAGEENNNNKTALWLIGGLIAIIIIVGLIYWYLSRGISKQANQPLQTPAPVSRQEPDLEEDLNAIELGDIETELSEVDKDLESL